MKTEFKFEIMHAVIDGKHLLSFIPAKKSDGYSQKNIEVTAEQWDALRFHFMTAVNDTSGVSKLSYIP